MDYAPDRKCFDLVAVSASRPGASVGLRMAEPSGSLDASRSEQVFRE